MAADYGLQVFDAAGRLDFSLTGRTPRFHSSGTFVVPRLGNGVAGNRLVYTITIPVAEITNPAEWWVVDIISTSATYSYFYNEIFSATINVGNIVLVIRINDTTYNMPFKYVLMKLK